MLPTAPHEDAYETAWNDFAQAYTALPDVDQIQIRYKMNDAQLILLECELMPPIPPEDSEDTAWFDFVQLYKKLPPAQQISLSGEMNNAQRKRLEYPTLLLESLIMQQTAIKEKVEDTQKKVGCLYNYLIFSVVVSIIGLIMVLVG